jgi:ribose 1,5-bisphosphokinase PhnN
MKRQMKAASSNQARYQNTETEHCLNIDNEAETETTVKEFTSPLRKHSKTRKKEVMMMRKKNSPEITCGVHTEIIP